MCPGGVTKYIFHSICSVEFFFLWLVLHDFVSRFFLCRKLLGNCPTPYQKYAGHPLTRLICFPFSVCPGSITLTETSGVITSPFFPRNYPDNQSCSWQITARQGNRVKLEIENSLNIQQCGGAACTCDYLQVQNGFSDDPNVNERICGVPGSKTYYSTHESLKVLFVSDDGGSKRYDGFSATYTQVNRGTISSYWAYPGRSR